MQHTEITIWSHLICPSFAKQSKQTGIRKGGMWSSSLLSSVLSEGIILPSVMSILALRPCALNLQCENSAGMVGKLYHASSYNSTQFAFATLTSTTFLLSTVYFGQLFKLECYFAFAVAVTARIKSM